MFRGISSRPTIRSPIVRCSLKGESLAVTRAVRSSKGGIHIIGGLTSSMPTTILPESATSCQIHNGFHRFPAASRKSQNKRLCHAPAEAIRARALDEIEDIAYEGKATKADGMMTVKAAPMESIGTASLDSDVSNSLRSVRRSSQNLQCCSEEMSCFMDYLRGIKRPYYEWQVG